MIHLVPIHERFAYFTERGRNRKVIKTDLDQAHFLIATAFWGSGVKIESELNNSNFKIKKAVDEILKWYAAAGDSSSIRSAAETAWQLVDNWRNRKDRPRVVQMSLYEQLEEDE